MKISHTAAFIAVKLYGLTRKPAFAAKFDPFILNFYQNIVQSLPSYLRWYGTALKSSFIRSLFILSEELFLPGDLMHILCRKYFVGKEVRELIDSGFEQIVNLGAGFDHLGAYYSQKGIPVFELDRQSMIGEKNGFLNQHEYLNANLHFVACDLEFERSGEALRAHPEFDPKKKTVFIAEGLFDYLDLLPSERVVEDILSMNAKNKLVTTFFSIDELNYLYRAVFRGGIAMVGETLKFKITRDEFVELLEELGLELEVQIDHQQMKKEFVEKSSSKLPVMKGFYVQLYGIKA
ncbi:MAG: class I SAM-dependent methyltransferase [Balneolaceae bacterium]|nr:class I SAM-dependent methyltransferase [Balneolaceae bacterium]